MFRPGVGGALGVLDIGELCNLLSLKVKDADGVAITGRGSRSTVFYLVACIFRKKGTLFGWGHSSTDRQVYKLRLSV